MALTEKGRFCSSCQKDIVDYSEMTNEEIQSSLQNANGTTCGIFKKRQLTYPIRSQVTSRFKFAFILVFLMGISSTDLYSQGGLQTFLPAGSGQNLEDVYLIEGMVMDEDSMALPFIKLWVEVDTTIIESGRIYTKSDFEGRFRIKLPSGIETPINLVAAGLGYDTSMVSGITFKQGENRTVVNVTLSENGVLGVVGLIYCPPIITREPYEIGKIKIKGEDVRW